MDVVLESEPLELVSPDGSQPERKLRPSRNERHKRRIIALHGEVEQLQSLADTLLEHLEAAISPRITDADRIRYRCMIHDIRETLENKEQH